MDTLSSAERSHRMSLVRGRDTKPEVRVRKALTRLGYRYRLHPKGLPGHPDLVFPGRRLVLFVHGCYWHRHEGCPRTRIPKSNVDFWVAKLNENAERDRRSVAELNKLGWRVSVIWECETEREPQLLHAIERATEDDHAQY